MRSFNLSFLFTLAAAITYAQEQPTFEKKIIKNSDGKIYWQLQLPIYLQASTTADGSNALKLDLVKTESMQKHANPMMFDGHGVHYIRHIDYDNAAHEQDIAFEINVDGIAPKTTLTLGSAPAYNNGKWFFGKNLSGVLKATDEMSGVENMHQSINGSAYSINNGTISFQEEKEYSINYFSVDRVGNTEKAQTKSFVVDLTPPVTNYDVTTDHLDGKIISPRTVITLKSTDNLSGVKKVEYNFDGGNAVNYSGRVWQTNLSDGDHTLNFTSVDQVSNNEENKQYTFYLDKIAPTVASSFDANFIKRNGKMYVAKATTIQLTGSDNKAGVKNIYYVINGVNETEYTGAFKLPQKQGAYSVKFRAVDNVNNKSALATNDDLANIFLDDTPPALSHTVGLPKVYTRDTLFVTKASNIQLKSVDLESGAAKIEYSLDNTSTTTYEQGFQVNNEGYHTVSYTGYDLVNNSASKNFFFMVDNTGPEIFSHMSLEKIGTQKLEGSGKEIPVFASGTSVYLAATDKLVGTKAIFFSIDNTAEGVYSAPVKLLTKGKHALTLRAVDFLGNETKLEPIEFVIQ